jgi:hypothetical protein
MNTKSILLAACLLTFGAAAPELYCQNFTFSTIAGGSPGLLDGANSNAQFLNLTGVAVDRAGNLYVADQGNNAIRKITPLGADWIVTTIAGGTQGSLDGTNSAAQFYSPAAIAVDSSGKLYVSDQLNTTIRQITPAGANWVVTTIAGMAGISGNRDGTNSGARFSAPAGIAVDASGNIFVADEANNTVRKIMPLGTNWIVTTVAGGGRGFTDGSNTTAQFSGPAGVAADSNGRLFVADQFNNAIRLITPAGPNWVVTTIAGDSISGRSDGVGTNARFSAPLNVAVDNNGVVYVADMYNNAIRRIALVGTNWTVTTTAGGSVGSADGTGTNAQFNFPFGLAADDFGDVFVADSRNNAIRLGVAAGSAQPTGGLQVMITPSSAIAAGAAWQLDGGTTLQTNGASLSGLVAGNHTIRFTAATGYTTPAAQTIPVTVRQTAVAAGNYPNAIANAGSLQVLLSPAAAVNVGAQWQVDSGAWQTNGGIAAGLSPGAHNLSFYSIPGWTPPSSQVVQITNTQTTLASGTYVLQTGSLCVTIFPAAVVAAGAKWYFDGGYAPQASGTTLTGLLPGVHVVTFNTALGWEPQSGQAVCITNALTNSAAATYGRPPQLAGTLAAGGRLQFVLRGQSGGNYVVQASTDLVNWRSISTNAIPAGGSIPISDSDMTNYVRRFYRAVTVTTSPPQLVVLTANRVSATLVLNGQTGSQCVIQASSNLVNWTAILTNIIPDAGTIQITDSGATSQNRRFYRAAGQ